MNMEILNDIAFIKILKNNLDLKRFTQKEPIKNSLKLTANEYREFLSTFGFTMNFMKKWMNDVTLREGVWLPFSMKEIQMGLKFQEKSAHIMLELEKSAEKAFEREFWDEASAPKGLTWVD